MKNLPKDWTACEVSTVAEVNPRKPKAAPEELVSFVGMADVSEDMRLVNHAPRPYAEVANGFTGFEDNDILVAKITPCFENGKGALVTGLTNGKGFGSTEFHVVRAEDESTRRLLYHHFSTHEFRVRGEANMTGSAGQKRIPTSFISKYVVPLPPQATREKIVAILDACDRAIDGTTKLLEKQEKRKRSLFEKLLYPKDENGNWKWPLTSIGAVATYIKRGITPTYHSSASPYLILNQKAIRWGRIDASSLKYGCVDTSPLLRKESLIRQGDVVINSTGDVTTGRAFCFDETPSFLAADSHVTIIRTDEELLDPHYLVACFESDRGQYQIYSLVNGSTGQIELTPSALQAFKLNLPPIEMQRKISFVLQSCNKEIKLHHQQLVLLQQQKKGLMQRLLTGQAFNN